MSRTNLVDLYRNNHRTVLFQLRSNVWMSKSVDTQVECGPPKKLLLTHTWVSFWLDNHLNFWSVKSWLNIKSSNVNKNLSSLPDTGRRRTSLWRRLDTSLHVLLNHCLGVVGVQIAMNYSIPSIVPFKKKSLVHNLRPTEGFVSKNLTFSHNIYCCK